MESSRVTCPHCDFLFYPEEGVSLDDCPVCGRTVEVKPAPAPQPGMAAFVALADKAADNAFEVIAQLRAHISDLTLRLAEVEAENVRLRPRAEIAGILLTRTSKAEKRCRELEATIDAMTEAHGHDDRALTAAYLSGAHAGKKQAEAFKSHVMAWARGRCECCEHKDVRREDAPCEQCLHTSNYDNWTPPQAWEAGE